MRANTETYVTRSSTDNDSIRMSFDENSLGFLMDVMTNLYSDPVSAPIREYSSNALDSHIDAGVTRPVEVTLPTEWSRTFIVQDYGLGMSVDDLNKIYSKYGYSTKRDSDAAVGMLGLGSKSGLTYADQFTVVAVKNGVKTMANVARGDDGAGVINILDTSQTNEPNGVTIKIPVHNVSLFRHKAHEFYRWWEPGTVLVDGKEPERPDDDNVMRVEDDILIYKGVINEDYIVMGCVAYPVSDRLSRDLPWGHSVVAYVPMGAVNFPPNREGLQYTKRTLDCIDGINERRAAGLKAAAESDIKNAKTYSDAIRRAGTWHKILGGQVPQYRGQDIPSYVFSHKDANGLPQPFFFYDSLRYRSRLMTLNRIEAERFVNTLVITDFTNINLSSQNRRKIKLYMEQEGLDYNSYIATDKLFGSPWNDGVETVSWDEIKTLRLSTSGRSATKGKTTYDIYDGNHGNVDKVVADSIILVSPTYISTRLRDHTTVQSIHATFPDATLVVLGKNRWDKFAREHDNVLTLQEAIEQRAAEFNANLTDYEYLEVKGNSWTYEDFVRLDPAKIDDPVVRELASQDTLRSREHEWSGLRYLARIAETHVTLDEREVEYQEVLDKYPFVQYASRVGREHPEHVYTYINLIYREGKESE